jgi:hypothetical protein
VNSGTSSRGKKHITTVKTGLAANNVPARELGGVIDKPKTLNKLANPKKKPRVNPELNPSDKVPTITGKARIVTLIKPKGISPSGVNPNTNIRATRIAVTVRFLVLSFFMCFSVQAHKGCLTSVA